ncbi:E3 SUMO-protein ligase ZBED1-like [Gigantopelta aegis]|uniref:E3 SUMO-protein ligase ZBED1-like n=1 Tax=Gigantopelta aegis TaxID=1735272 RepID=UPI001B887448|nr:E3 SUMO-protein ligase ZBED1-like [Gigantopelta aegis]
MLVYGASCPFFHRSTTAAALLKVKTKQLGLKTVKLLQDVPTRWNSACDMLERFLELQPVIYAVLVAKEIRRNVNDISTLSEANITIAEDSVACLLPLKAIITVLCTEKMPTVAIILPLQRKLLTSVLVSKEMDSDVIKQMKKAMASDLDSRYANKQVFLQECTVLDPRFKASCVTTEQQHEVYDRLATEAACLKLQPQLPVSVEPSTSTPTVTDLPTLPGLPDVESTDLQSDVRLVDDVKSVTAITTKITNDLTTQSGCASGGGIASILGDVVFIKEEMLPQKSNLAQAIFEIDVFKGQALIPVSEDPLVWWKGHQWQFPLLSQLAKKWLCIPATSVPPERVFSTAGDIVTAQRAVLNLEVVDMLIFLKK